MHPKTLTFAIVIIALTTLAPSTASSESPESVVHEATEAFQRGDFDRAAELFQTAFDLDPHPVIMFNLARAHQERGDLPAALLFFRTLRTIDAPPHILDAADARIIEVEDILIDQGYDPMVVTSSEYVPRGSLTITTQPENAAVYISGSHRGTTPLNIPLIDEGRYALRIELEGYHPITAQADVRGGRLNLRSYNLTPRTSLEDYVPPTPGYVTVRAPASGLTVAVDGDPIGVTPLIAFGLAPGTYSLTVADSGWETYSTTVEVHSGSDIEISARMRALDAAKVADPNRTRRTAGIALMGVGAASIATGAVLGLTALSSASEYRSDPANPDRASLRDSARRQALISDVTLGAGIALAASGALVYFVAGQRADTIDRDLLVGPALLPGGLGVVGRTSF